MIVGRVARPDIRRIIIDIRSIRRAICSRCSGVRSPRDICSVIDLIA